MMPNRSLQRIASPPAELARWASRTLHISMKSLLILLVSLASFPAIAAGEASFKTCESESFLALSVARNYLLGGKKKEAVTPYLSDSAFDQALAEQLFRQADAGEVKHHSQFAADKLLACASREGVAVEQTRASVEACFVKVDIPFFLYLGKEEGLSKSDAIAKVERIFPDRDTLPSSLIAAVAERVFAASGVQQVQRTSRALFWSCMYP